MVAFPPTTREVVAVYMSSMPPNATSFETQSVSCDSAPSWCFGRESVVAAIEAIKRGEHIVVVDDETRENEGDLILAAELATKESIAFMVSSHDDCQWLLLHPRILAEIVNSLYLGGHVTVCAILKRNSRQRKHT